MKDNYKKQYEAILAKSQLDPKSGCILTMRPVSRGQIYPKIKVTHHKKAYIQNIHTFTYKYENNIEPHNRYASSLDVSHLCHNPLCINLTHLTLEPHRINIIRRTCHTLHACIGHGDYPNCLISKIKHQFSSILTYILII
jgi:hypothetical protein